jgi:hypothetical protein
MESRRDIKAGGIVNRKRYGRLGGGLWSTTTRQLQHVRCDARERQMTLDLGRRNCAAEKMEPGRRDRCRPTQATRRPRRPSTTPSVAQDELVRLLPGFWGLTDGAWVAQTTPSVPGYWRRAAYGIPPPTLVQPPLHTLNPQFYQSTITPHLYTAPTSEQSLLC